MGGWLVCWLGRWVSGLSGRVGGMVGLFVGCLKEPRRGTNKKLKPVIHNTGTRHLVGPATIWKISRVRLPRALSNWGSLRRSSSFEPRSKRFAYIWVCLIAEGTWFGGFTA